MKSRVFESIPEEASLAATWAVACLQAEEAFQVHQVEGGSSQVWGQPFHLGLGEVPFLDLEAYPFLGLGGALSDPY